MQVPDGLLEGIVLFNEGDYFEAHEAWEDHWGKGGPEERELTLGLIKAAVALHHLAHGNRTGFLWQAAEAIPRLRAHAPHLPTLGLEDLAEALDSLCAQTRFHGALPEGWAPPRLALGDGTDHP